MSNEILKSIHRRCLFFLFLFYNLIFGGVTALDIFVGNIKKYQLNYKIIEER